MSGVSIKRAINDTSFDANSSFEDDNNKKTENGKGDRNHDSRSWWQI